MSLATTTDEQYIIKITIGCPYSIENGHNTWYSALNFDMDTQTS